MAKASKARKKANRRRKMADTKVADKSADKNKTAGKATWTVMVHLAGDNDLDSAGAVDLGEMKQVGSSARQIGRAHV